MGKQILSSDKIVRLNNYSLLGLVQSSDLAPNFGAQDINELGRIERVDTAYELESSGSFTLESSGGMAGLLARMLPTRTASAFTGFLYSGAGASTNKNAYTITEADVHELQFDIVQYEQPDQANFTRSVVVPRAFPATITGRLDANGMGTETINWQAQELYGFDTPYHDVIMTTATRTTSTTATVLDTTVTSAAYTLIYVWIDEVRYRTVNTDPSYVTFAANVITFVGGDTIPADAIVRAVAYKTTSPSTTFPQLVADQRGTVAFYIKGWQADMFLGVADVDNPSNTERLQKVQSADWSIDFNLQPLRQILKNTAGTAIYCRVPTTPYVVSLTCSLYESDWAEWRKILNADGASTPKFPTSGNDVYTDSYDWAPTNLKGSSDVPLISVLRYYTKAGNLLQSVKFSDLRMESQSDRIAVGGRAEIQLGLRGTKFEFEGANPTA
jgi:hypothetical protein